MMNKDDVNYQHWVKQRTRSAISGEALSYRYRLAHKSIPWAIAFIVEPEKQDVRIQITADTTDNYNDLKIQFFGDDNVQEARYDRSIVFKVTSVAEANEYIDKLNNYLKKADVAEAIEIIDEVLSNHFEPPALRYK